MTVGRIPSVEGGIQPTIVDAKGDLIAAVAADSLNRLAVGSNDQVLVADSAASTGLAWKSYGAQVVAGKNAVINGGMDIWQRGTSFASPTQTYTADRWTTLIGATAPATTVSRQTTSDTTNLPTIQYCARVARNSGQTNTGNIYLSQSLESVNSTRFAGQKVTLSFWARKGANYSAASSLLLGELLSGTGTDQNVNSGLTGSSLVSAISATLTTTWQRFTFTGTVSATATQLGFYFYFTPVGTAGAADYFEVTGVQLEEGSVATPFSRAGGTIQGELAACMRYCVMFNSSEANGDFLRYGVGQNTDTTQTFTQIPLSPPMRVVPSLTTTGTAADYAVFSRNTVTACNTVPVLGGNSVSPKTLSVYSTVASGLTIGNAMQLTSNNNKTSYLLLTAEL